MMIRIGIAGTGTIVPDFLEAAARVDRMDVRAICSTPRSVAKARELAETWNIPEVFSDYETMLQSPDLDVVYVAVPNHLHYDFSKKALEHGKSVICEKPFCSNLRQAEELRKLALERHLFLFEAISNQYFPNYEKVRGLLSELGQMKIAQLNYSQYSRRYDAFKRGEILPVFDPKKSGGALMDLNVYNIHFLTGLFGRPESVVYQANMERGIDTSGVLILKYPDFVAVSVGAKDCKAPVSINLQGDKGCIHSDTPANVFSSFWMEDNEGHHQEYALNAMPERLYYELESFANMYEAHDEARNLEEMNHSILVQEILDEARRQAGILIPE